MNATKLSAPAAAGMVTPKLGHARNSIRPLAIALLLALAATVKAQDFAYTTSNGAITIMGYTGPGDVTIPSQINGLPVTTIGEISFYGNAGLTSVTIPDSVTTIGNQAFGACYSLTSVTIPNSVTNIGYLALSDCLSLTSITVEAQNPAYSSLNGVLFNKSRTQLFQFPPGLGGSFTIPDSVTTIGDYAFYGSSLTHVAIPNSVATIGDAAFFNCSSLTSVTIGNSVTTIVGVPFPDCHSLTAITVEAQNPAYSSLNGVLFNKGQTQLLHFPEGLGGSYTIPDSVTNIGDQAFEVCTNLTSVTIGNSVTTIGEAAFAACYSLTNVIIPNSVTSIGNSAFYCCTRLTAVLSQGNAPSVGSGVFGSVPTTVYYLPGTVGWGATFAGRPTAPWVLPNPVILTSGPGFGVQTNGFGFIISWATNISVVVEACTNLDNPSWSPLATNTLSNGSSSFNDSDWTNHPARFYRLRAQ